ncbi:MAG: NAD(P)-dependent oxidoreductase [Paracraurococcus sp.]
MDRHVGVIGLGIMGGAMARNLKDAGWRVTGFDTDAGRGAELAAAGIELAADATAVARAAPLLLCSLPKPAALAATAAAIAGAGLPPRIVVETSTFTLEDKRAAEAVLAAAGHTLLDCPLSGTGAQAVTRDIVVYASGDAAAIASLGPLFAGFARAAHNLGAFGNGTRMKFVANLLVAIHNLAAAEAMVLAEKAGLDPAQVVGLVASGVGTSRVFELRAPMMAAKHYEPPTMRNAMWSKDLAVIGEFATSLNCPTPLFSAVLPLHAATLAAGLGGEDTAAIHAVLARLAGLNPPSPPTPG